MKVKCTKCNSEYTSPIPLPDATCDNCPTCKDIEKTIKDWFERNKSNHNLNKADVEELTQFLIQKYYEKYGNKLRN